MTSPHITSVYGSAETEYTIKKSRFLIHLREVTCEEEASAFIEARRKEFWDARHNCYAYQIGPDGAIQKSNDDGEPSGTAGRPMLEVLKKNSITNTVVVVTRYFGGIKLGASGLIRAYSHCVTLGLEAAEIADYLPYQVVNVSFPYSFVSVIERLVPSYAVRIADRSFASDVTFTLEIPEEQAGPAIQAITNATNGNAICKTEKTKVIPIVRT
ncbi:MAG: YigZ family protein [Caecibacter massiliensis]|uniref:YigZ family protein n=1 Tax=unclassified Megasphaera TaxID=2626256 RepID=UPI0025BA8E41|nr:YigZ family protein [Megasphaera sp. UBA4233]MCI5532763.1 YigZ family protein [Caecibacter massiliensis]MDY2904046.1 YigZ family protein [Caecibacter massiliensis]